MRTGLLPVSSEFRSFAELLSAAGLKPQAADPDPCQAEQEANADEDGRDDYEFETLRELRLFRAKAADALDAAVHEMLGDVAAEVLARELQLAPADIGRIVNRALKRFAAAEPLRVRVHPHDAQGLHLALPIRPDESLRPGDAVIELRCGSIDASLGARLASAVAPLSLPA